MSADTGFTLIVHPDHPWVWEAWAMKNRPDIAGRLDGVLANIKAHASRVPAVALFMDDVDSDFVQTGTKMMSHKATEHPRDVAKRIIANHGQPTAICGFWRDRCVRDIAKCFPSAEILTRLSAKYPF